MDSQLQQLRDAVKAVAKARAEGRPIDLSTLPPAIREKLEAQLNKLPPEARKQLQSGVAKLGQHPPHAPNRQPSPVHTAVIPKFNGHYNGTIQPGDAARVPWFWIAFVLIGSVLLLQYLE